MYARPSASQWLILIVLSLLWGGSFFFVGISIKEVPPFTLVLGRVMVAAFCLHLINRLRGNRSHITWPLWKMFFFLGALNNVVPFSLLVWGQTQLASSVASVLNATTPLFTVIVAHLMTTDEKLSLPKGVAVLLGFCGVAVLMGVFEQRFDVRHMWPYLACVGAALTYAFGGVFAKRSLELPVAPLEIAAGQLTASSLMLAPLVLVLEKPWLQPVPSPQVWAAWLALGVISTALAYTLFFRLLATAGSTILSLVTFLIPVSALVLGIVFLNEQLLTRHIAGMALIAAGLVCIDGRIFSRLKKR